MAAAALSNPPPWQLRHSRLQTCSGPYLPSVAEACQRTPAL